MKILSFAILLGASTTLAAQTAPATQKPAPVSVQGCVDRAVPNAPVMYLLIDAQAGGASPVIPSGRGGTPPPPPPPKAPAHVEPRYWLTSLTSLDFSKFQNQRVEVVGIVLNAPAMKPGEKPIPDAPKATLQVTTVKMLSTECKAR